MIPLTLAIVACNEEDRIGRAIASLPCVNEVLVLDSGSTDSTVAVAESHGARVISTDWPGYGAQKNRALEAATQPWVLFLDSDEWVDVELADALGRLSDVDPSIHGYAVKRRNHWLGRPLRGGCMGPSWKVRIVRSNCARWEGGILHETLEVEGRVARLEGVLEHDPYRCALEQKQTSTEYAGLFVQKALAQGRVAGFWDPYVRPVLHFVKSILFRAGFLDGLLGWRMAWLGALEVAEKWSLLRNRQSQTRNERSQDSGRHIPCKTPQSGGRVP